MTRPAGWARTRAAPDAWYRVGSPALRRLLVHCAETGGYMHGVDPLRFSMSTLNAAARKGLVVADSGGCVLTEKGREAVAWALPIGGAAPFVIEFA